MSLSDLRTNLRRRSNGRSTSQLSHVCEKLFNGGACNLRVLI